VDPLHVVEMDDFNMSIDEYERVCSKKVKKEHLKLTRASLEFQPADDFSYQMLLALDPYYAALPWRR
jgi:hypothetical protein